MYEEEKTDPSGNVYEVEKVGEVKKERGREGEKERGREGEREIEVTFINKCIFRRKRTCIVRSTTTVRQ